MEQLIYYQITDMPFLWQTCVSRKQMYAENTYCINLAVGNAIAKCLECLRTCTDFAKYISIYMHFVGCHWYINCNFWCLPRAVWIHCTCIAVHSRDHQPTQICFNKSSNDQMKLSHLYVNRFTMQYQLPIKTTCKFMLIIVWILLDEHRTDSTVRHVTQPSISIPCALSAIMLLTYRDAYWHLCSFWFQKMELHGHAVINPLTPNDL
jgi:hypothetical protein